VFQFYNLMPTLTAQKNVELPLLLTKLGAAQRKRNAEIALKLVGLEDARQAQAE
jgi:putative ABC transport system ATP-binding protein